MDRLRKLVKELWRGEGEETFGTSIFLIGMYRFGMSERAFLTVRIRERAMMPEKMPYILSIRE